MSEFNHESVAINEVNNGTANDATYKAVELDKIAKANGFNEFKGSEDGQTFFSWGTELDSSGKAQFRDKNKLHHEMDFAVECAAKFEKTIEAEERKNTRVSLSQLYLDSLTNKVSISNGVMDESYTHTRWSLGQLLNRANAPSGALTVLSPTDVKHQKLPCAMRNDIFNTYMANARSKKGFIEANLRTRKFKSRNEIYAAVSPRYQEFDGNQACREFAKFSPETAKGQIKYDGKRWKFTVTVKSDIEPTVGEIFEARAFITGTDDGSAPVTVGSEVVRVRCRNLTVLTSEITDSVKHSCKTMIERINELMVNANTRISEFAEVWKKANTDNLADPAIIEQYGIDKLFKLMVDRKLVTAQGVSAEDMSSRLLSAWSVEPGYTKAAVLNAVTRCAHSNSWENTWQAEEISTAAGEMLYNRLYFNANDFASLEA